MRNLKQQVLLVAIGSLVLIGCASTPMKELKASEMIVFQKNKYVDMKSSEGLQEWEKGLWEYKHKNYTKARKLLEPHKNKKVSMIQHAFGYMYTTGEGGLERNLKKAEMHYKKAIEIDNYPNSLHNLAALYFNGWGSLARDDNHILELYQKAAKAGYVLSQYSLGNIYHFGRNGFSEDYGKAYYWYQQASNQGHAQAARRIGYMYENEHGLKKDLEKAFYWHKLTAKRGNKHSKGDMIRLKSILYKKNKNK
jgi:TPR repeat protein